MAIAIIPARLASTRFPGKLLADRTGKPLICHVLDQVRKARQVHRVILAADHTDIRDAVADEPGIEVFMTREDHPNGTSRLAEVAEQLPQDCGLIVNVQGDEPLIEPEVIDQLILGLEADPDAPMATLGSEFAAGEDPADPNIVKLIVNQQNRAIYFSRSLIPFDRDGDGTGVRPLKHPGMYAYRRDFLIKYAALPATPLEQTEKLEQLRAIEHGYPIAVIRANCEHHGIDTPEQYEAFVAYWQTQGG